jgi:DNA repair exonuclease SbcCD ATPase subunit
VKELERALAQALDDDEATSKLTDNLEEERVNLSERLKLLPPRPATRARSSSATTMLATTMVDGTVMSNRMDSGFLRSPSVVHEEESINDEESYMLRSRLHTLGQLVEAKTSINTLLNNMKAIKSQLDGCAQEAAVRSIAVYKLEKKFAEWHVTHGLRYSTAFDITELSSVEEYFGFLLDKVFDIEESYDAIKEDMEEMEAQLEEFQFKEHDLESELEESGSATATAEAADFMEQRLQMRNEVSLRDQVVELVRVVDVMNKKVAELRQDIEEKQGDITVLDSRISEVEGHFDSDQLQESNILRRLAKTAAERLQSDGAANNSNNSNNTNNTNNRGGSSGIGSGSSRSPGPNENKIYLTPNTKRGLSRSKLLSPKSPGPKSVDKRLLRAIFQLG